MTSIEVAPASAVSLDNYIGQERTKRLIDVEVELAFAEKRPFPHMLLFGPPGCGKTTIARAVAAELGDPLLVIARPVAKRSELCELLLTLQAGVAFIDEIHHWSTAQTAGLLTVMEEHYLDDPDFGKIEFPWLTVIAATTERNKLDPAIVSRFGLVPQFVDYTDAEMGAIVAQMAERAGLELPAAVCAQLGKAAGGVPRQARQLVDRARALRAGGEALTVESICDLADIQLDGLSVEHMRYLHVLDDMRQAGLTVIANRLRLHESEVINLERLLLDRGYVRLGSRGRLITPTGRQRATDKAVA